ncbi:MAG: hypothetical protein HUU38_21295 [Anaerolineales bacterium]|nr:hypothetical protein [Anaerolineales bacterium]
MYEAPVAEEKTAAPPEVNGELWSTNPILGSLNGRVYQGRIFVEVWDNDVHFVVDEHNIEDIKAKVEIALNEFRKPYTSVEIDKLQPMPVSGEIPGNSYLGRLIIEFWDNEPIIGIEGEKALVVQKGIEILRSSLQRIY